MQHFISRHLSSFGLTAPEPSPLTAQLIEPPAPIQLTPLAGAQHQAVRITDSLRSAGINIPEGEALSISDERTADQLAAFVRVARQEGLQQTVFGPDDNAFRGAVKLIGMGLLPEVTFPDGPKNWAIVLALYGSEPERAGLSSLRLADRFGLLRDAGVALDTALVAAIKGKQIKMLSPLLEAGARPWVTDRQGNGPLHGAILGGADLATLRNLIQSDCWVFAINNDKTTPLNMLLNDNPLLFRALIDEAKNAPGSAWAEIILGATHELGLGTEPQPAKAVQHYREAAVQGHPLAQIRLGMMYEDGRGVEADEPTAFDWIAKAARSENAWAQLALAEAYEQGAGTEKNDARAAEFYEKAARQGLETAQFRLGEMHQFGIGTSKNERLAAYWYAQSAQQGSGYAQNALGTLLQQGLGIEKNERLAAKYYKEAAQQGIKEAQYNLGVMHLYGDGVEQDEILAASWLQKAADQGFAEAQNALGTILLDQPERGLDAAIKWFQKAADQGHTQAQHNLGWAYLTKAAKQGHEDASHALKYCAPPC